MAFTRTDWLYFPPAVAECGEGEEKKLSVAAEGKYSQLVLANATSTAPLVQV